MRIRLSFILMTALLFGAVARARADEQSDMKAMIARGIKAVGGETNLKKFKAISRSETGTYHGMGNALPYIAKTQRYRPNRLKFEIEGFYTVVVNGDKGWVNVQGSTQDLTDEQLADQKDSFYAENVQTLVPLSSSEYKLAALGETEVDDRPAIGIKVSNKDHNDLSLFFDKESGLLVKVDQRVKDLEDGGKEVGQETWYRDYKDAGGLKVAMKYVIKRDGKPFVEGETTDVKLHEKLDDSVFAKP